MIGQRFPYHRFGELRLLAATRMAFDPRKLAIAALGLILLHAGWSVLDVALPASSAVTPSLLEPPVRPIAPDDGPTWLADWGTMLTRRILEPIRILTTPLQALLDPASGWGTMVHALLALFWLFAVWGMCGGAIARLAVIQEAQMRQPRIGEGIGFALRSGSALILAPFLPLFALIFCTPIGMVFGLLYRLPSGAMVAGVGLVIPLAFGLIMTLLLAGLVAGWPLLHAAMAAGADDALDALSRTYSYLNQKLGMYLVGATLALVVGLLGLLAMDLLAGGVLRLTQWNLSLTGDPVLIESLFRQRRLEGVPATVAVHNFWLVVVRFIVQTWIYSFFWTATAFLFLWLREDVDGTSRTVIDPPVAAARSTSVPDVLATKVPIVPEVSSTSPKPD